MSTTSSSPTTTTTLPAESWQEEQAPISRPFSPRGVTGNPSFSLLPPLNTATPSPAASTPRARTPQRQSPLPPRSAAVAAPPSRPQSMLFSTFHSSLTYASVRDFAYPLGDILHYGPPAAKATTAAIPRTAKTSKGKDKWRGEPGEGKDSPTNLDLSGAHFGDGPPWKEDEDLLSPVVRTTKHKKSRSTMSDLDIRGRREDRSGNTRQADTQAAPQASGNAKQLEEYHHFLASAHQDPQGDEDDEDDEEEYHPSDNEDESRYSRDYSFHITSPDEEFHGRAVALYDFTRENDNELPLSEGQMLWISYRHGEGWLVASDPKTGENGLVPEEYVRMVRDIEGGLSGLNGQLAGFSPGSEGQEPGLSPELETPTTATSAAPLHERNISNNSTSSEHYTPIVSHFTTSSADLHPYAGPPLEKGVSPRIPQHSPSRSPVRTFQKQERSGSTATDMIALAREQMAEEETKERIARMSLRPEEDRDEFDESEPVILEDAVAREIRRSQGPPV